MKHLIKGELIKILSTRTLLGYLLAGVALTVANVVVVGLASGRLDEVGEKEEALAGLPVLFLLLGVVGAAGEHRHRTAAPAALVARRDRGHLLLARAGAYAATGLAVGAVMTGVSLAVGLPLLGRQPGPGLSTGDVAAVAAGCLAAAVFSTVIGVAAGALVRSQVVGVVGVLILTFMVSPLIGIVRESAPDYTPFGAADLLARMRHGPHHVPLDGAAAVMAVWAAALLVAAVASERRRDLA